VAAAILRVRLGGLRPHSAGVYVNFLSDEGATGLQAAYGDRLQPLTALKDRWDPADVFRMNANIAPQRPRRVGDEGGTSAV